MRNGTLNMRIFILVGKNRKSRRWYVGESLDHSFLIPPVFTNCTNVRIVRTKVREGRKEIPHTTACSTNDHHGETWNNEEEKIWSHWSIQAQSKYIES